MCRSLAARRAEEVEDVVVDAEEEVEADAVGEEPAADAADVAEGALTRVTAPGRCPAWEEEEELVEGAVEVVAVVVEEADAVARAAGADVALSEIGLSTRLGLD